MKRIAELYLYENRTQDEIASGLGISPSTVKRYLKDMRETWQKSALMDFDEAKKRELAKIDRLEEEYWVSWKHSLGESEDNKNSVDFEQIDRFIKEKNKTGKSGSEGNPRYLQGIQWCINKRCEILGINAPRQVKKDESMTFVDLVKGVHANNGKR